MIRTGQESSGLVRNDQERVSRKFKRCLKCKGWFKDVSSVFQGNFKGVYRKFRGCFKEVSRVFQGSFKSFPWTFQGNCKGVLRNFKGCFK